MSDDEPIDLGAPEILFDGIQSNKIIEGVVRIALYSRHNGERVIVGRLAIPLSELPDVIQSLVILLTEAAKTIVKPALSS